MGDGRWVIFGFIDFKRTFKAFVTWRVLVKILLSVEKLLRLKKSVFEEKRA